MVIASGELTLRDVEVPEPRYGEVLVRVAATAVNRADLLQVKGLYPAPPDVPADIPGLEFSGTVERLGEGVVEFSEGDAVSGLVGGGAYAEYLRTPARTLSPAPRGMSSTHAAALPEAFLTAYDAIVVQGGLKSGEVLLVHAAASGVGTAAVQLGASLGATVIATSRSEAKLSRVRELGAALSIVPKGEHFADEVKRMTGGRGADVVLDLVGGGYTRESLLAAAPGGRVLLVGLTGGRSAELDLADVLRRRLTLRGTVLRSRPLEEKIALATAFTRNILPLVERKMVHPVIDRVLPLEEAGVAHAAVLSNQTFGKVVLLVRPEA